MDGDDDNDHCSAWTAIEIGMIAAIAIAQVAYVIRHVYF